MAVNIMTQRAAMNLVLIVLWQLVSITAFAQGTAFSYQGKLSDSGNPANGQYDFQFKLFDTATVGTGTQLGSTLTPTGLQVSDGVFTVRLDFGACAACFDGSTRFLEIAVRPTGGDTFTTLGPRQPITATPYAIKSQSAAAADGLSVACINCLTSSQIASVSGSAVIGTIPVGSVPAGSTNYIQNRTSPQADASFNISGNGTAGDTLSGNIVNTATQFNLNGSRILGIGPSSIFVGVGAGGANNTGFSNTFVGLGAGSSNTTGFSNAFLGTSAGAANTTGFGNTFFGLNAGLNNASGSRNTFFGVAAGAVNTTGGSNAFFGNDVGQHNTTGSNNTLIGGDVDVSAGNLANATALGARALVGCGNCLVLGSINGINGATADTNVGIGTTTPTARLDVAGEIKGTLVNAATQYQIGGSRMLAVSGPFNNGLGTNLASSNTFLGESAGLNTTPSGTLSELSGKFNSFFGAEAGKANTTGFRNTFFGALAGKSNTTGNSNAFFGTLAGENNSTGVNNAFFGIGAGQFSSSGGNNSFFGNGAGQSNSNGSANAFFGTGAGFSNTGGVNNSFFGAFAGQNNATGSSNTLIGDHVNVSAGNLANATALGARALVDCSNCMVLGSIDGVNGAAANINVGIGTTVPLAALHVVRDNDSFTAPIAIIESTGFQAPLAFRSNGLEVARIRADNLGNLVFATLNGISKNIVFSAGDDSETDLFIQATTGKIGIGTTAPDQLLTVNGGASKPGGGSWAVFSDQRLKSIRGSYTAGLDEVMRLEPVRYEYKPDNALGIRASGEHIGFSAQAVERVIPEAVTRNAQGYLLVNNDPILWAMLNAIKQQQAQMERQRAENNELRQRLDQLLDQQAQLKQQQTEIERLKKTVCLAHPDADICK